MRGTGEPSLGEAGPDPAGAPADRASPMQRRGAILGGETRDARALR